MRFKRLRLSHLNNKAFRFMQRREFEGNYYRELQKSEIWSRAKEVLIAKRTRNHRKMLKCFFCKKPIKYKQSIVLHHKSYNWRKMFKPRLTRFSHYLCHKQRVAYCSKSPIHHFLFLYCQSHIEKV